MNFSLKVQQESQQKFYKLYNILTGVTIGAAILAFIGFILSLLVEKYKVKNVNKDLTVLKSFSFENPANIDISDSEPTLRKFGDDVFDCYVGVCNYYVEEIHYDCDGWGMCIPDRTERIDDGSSKAPLSCSENCGNNIHLCSECHNDKKYHYEFTCEHHESSKNEEGSCIQGNLASLWKGLYFKQETSNDYTLLDVVSSGESCPDGTKRCGILDEEYGNILCSKNTENCPINLITHDENEIKQYSTYFSFSFRDGSKLFYTYEAIETGIIARDIYFDMSYDNSNNNCKIVDSTSMRDIITDNNLSPENNIYETNTAYLIWCNPFTGKEKNTTKLKEQQKGANKNKTINDEIINPVTMTNIFAYIFCIIGFTFFGILLHQIYLAFNKENNIYMQSRCVCSCSCCDNPCCILILFFVAIAFIVVGIIMLIVNIDDLKELPDKLGFNHNICKTLIIFDFIFFVGFIAFISPFIIFVIFLCQKRDNTKVIPYYYN